MIEYIDVYKAFDVPVLSGVSLTVETRETISIVGPSGTGKSVLLKTTNGLLVPDSGDVRIDGASVYNADDGALAAIRRKVGYVFQYAALFDSMNVFENVCMGLPDGEGGRSRSPEVLGKVVEALEDVNLDPALVLGKLPSELSGGMRKRVGLARAIVGRPEILLYDEPVTGLDPINTATISRLILEIRERTQVTSLGPCDLKVRPVKNLRLRNARKLPAILKTSRVNSNSSRSARGKFQFSQLVRLS